MPSTLLYHYCSIDAFASIVSSRTVRLSMLNQSNDTEEGRWILRYLKHEIDQDKELVSIKDRIILHMEYAVQFNDFSGFCLSENGDLLSQWRGYADNGQGVAIGFSKSYLENLGKPGGGINLSAIIYEDPDQDSELVKLLQQIRQIAIKLSKSRRLSLLPTATEEQQQEYEKLNKSLILSVGPLMFLGHKYKNPSFSEECEWRLSGITLPFDGQGLSLKEVYEFRSAGDRLVPYRSVNLEESREKAIKAVVLGPRNLSRDDHISAMLEKYGFENVEISRSTATYR